MCHMSQLSQRGDIPAVVANIETFDILSPPWRVSYTPRPRSSFRKATRCPGIANVGSDRSTNSPTRAVTRSCLGVGTESAANGAIDQKHQEGLEIRALTSSSRLLSRNHARTYFRPCGRGPNTGVRGDAKMVSNTTP